MAKAKRLWSTLAPGTKAKYKRYGVTPQQYNAGKISSEFRKTINGKGGESFAVARAKQAGMTQVVPNFDSFSKRDKERAAEAYLTGNTHRIKPLIMGPNGTFKLEKLDTDYRLEKRLTESNNWITTHNKHYGHPLVNEDIFEAKMTLQGWFDKIGHGDMTNEDWKAFKQAYTASFTKSTRTK